jgi:iron complex transport system substrate-binding protein
MKIYTLLLALAVALAVGLTACGGDDNASSTPTHASTVTATVVPTVASGPFFDCTAAHPGTAADTSGFPVTVTDDAGDTVTLTAPPASIASLDAAHTEVLYAIGAAPEVKAVDKTSDCPAAAASLPKVDAFNPSVEAITALHPDLVILGFVYQSDIASALRSAGLTVLTLTSPPDINGVYDQIELMGKVTGHPGDADTLVTNMSHEVEDIGTQVFGKTQPTVYHEVDNTYYSAGPGSFIDDLYKTLGAKNIADSTGEAYPQLSSEAIIAANPDVIILADEDSGESATTVAARPGWSAIRAVASHRVYTVDPNIVSRPGPRIVDALKALEAALYPGS